MVLSGIPDLREQPSLAVCYTRGMKLPRAAASMHWQVARCLWRRAPSLPKADRLLVLGQAQCHALLGAGVGRESELRAAQVAAGLAERAGRSEVE